MDELVAYKAKAYDLIEAIERLQAELRKVNDQIKITTINGRPARREVNESLADR